MQNIKDILSGIEIPDPAQKVYLTLLESGEATARTVSHRTGITRTSVYDQIKILRAKGLVVERFIEGATLFAVSDVRQLSVLLEDRIDKMNTQQKFLSENIDSLVEKTQAVQPKIRFFEGEEGVKQLIRDILWYDNITLSLYWPYEQMLDFLGEDFLLWFSERRRKRNISIKAVWGKKNKKKESHVFSKGKDVERRYISHKEFPPMSYTIYDKKVAFISSHKESFGFIVESSEFSDLFKMQFDVLWKSAKKNSK